MGLGYLVKRARFRGWLIIAIATAAAGITWLVPRFTDSPVYFDFADQRGLFGIPHFMDVVSNAPYAVIGVLGLLFIGQSPESSFGERWERRAFAALFFGLLLVAGGSVYFHLAPSPATLLWDRLPMTIVFMSFFAIVAGDRINRRAGRILFAPLLAAGIASVLYWRYTELAGRGDLRWYVLVQFFPMLALPILAVFPGRFGRKRDFAVVAGLYALAKLFEVIDAKVFAATGFISGHTLKHLTSALAAGWLLRMTVDSMGTHRNGLPDEPGCVRIDLTGQRDKSPS